ncbi:hypothetical protein DM860_000751 [Cuscuta australis]|uniref:CRC domain-containing protein n=1 Tax=Cuscuta australis TaxID=267555 RepID=A0A328CX34_9ASTE|nr:hypothetical protein DM860_000751 [Cuscuta australis]
MDSPEPSKTAAAAAATATSTAASFSLAESAAVQESPVFNYINNLSPIGPVKTSLAVQGFPGINSPPLVFTSPRINPRIRSSFLERTRFPQLSNEEFSLKDGNQNDISALTDEAGSSNSRLLGGLVPCTDKAFDINTYVQEQPESQPICVDDFLVDAAKMGSADSRTNSPPHADDYIGSHESVNHIDGESKIENGIAMGAEKVEEGHKGKTSIDINKTFETDVNTSDDNVGYDQYLKAQPDSSAEIALDSQYAHRIMIEAGEHQRGIFRRCLQFDNLPQKTVKISDPCSFPESVDCVNSAASPIASEALEPISLNTQTQGCSQLHDSQNTENSTLKPPKPLGIGLHLNSIVNTVQGGCGARGSTISMKSAEIRNCSGEGSKIMGRIKYRVFDNFMKGSISSNVGEDILESIEESTLQGESSAHLALHNVKPMDNVVPLKLLECQSTPDHKRTSSSENVDGTSTSNQSSLKKKRKKTSDASDDDGCKRCNCKKSKCLKLYCDCFAAGIYCADLCACQGCFNKPEYEDTVMDTRQQIEAKNPLAFAPKVVQNTADSHSNVLQDNGVSVTPASARHKKGCNCKRSMCMKKYCDCYQANVGCSSACRCEGCMNTYGQKEDYDSFKGLVKTLVISGRVHGSSNEKLELVSCRGTHEHTELSHPHNMTPMTPSLQCSDHRNDESKSLFPSESPQSDHTMLSRIEISKRFITSSDNHELIHETTDILDLVSFDEEIENGNPLVVDESSRGDTVAAVIRAREHVYTGIRHLSSTGSFRWNSSPITPLINYRKKGVVDSVNSDDTPDILKDSSTPSNRVKVSSPNKKRVSPPHGNQKDSDCSSSA